MPKTTLGSRGYFFLIDISRRSRVNEVQSAEEKKITSGHRSTQPHFHARSGSNISPIPRSEVVRCRCATLADCRLADLQTCRLQTCRLADLQTCRLADLQTCRLVDLQTWRVSTPVVLTQNHF